MFLLGEGYLAENWWTIHRPRRSVIVVAIVVVVAAVVVTTTVAVIAVAIAIVKTEIMTIFTISIRTAELIQVIQIANVNTKIFVQCLECFTQTGSM